LDFAGNIPYNSWSIRLGKFGFLTNNRWQFSDDLSWVKGKHTIKVASSIVGISFHSPVGLTGIKEANSVSTTGNGRIREYWRQYLQHRQSFASFLLVRWIRHPEHPLPSDVL